MNPLIALVESAAREAFAATGEWRFFVPGRLEVFGKHTDYAGGRSLVAAVPRGFAVSALFADDKRVVVVDARSKKRFIGSADRFCAPTSPWHRYAAAVIRRLAINFPEAELSARIALASNLPSAAGISSSSALVISIAEALVARGLIDRSPRWMETIHTVEDRAAYYGCIENGASFGSLAGESGVGTHGGSEDHAGILASRAGYLQQFSFAPVRLERRIAMPEGWTFVVGSTGVRASKTGGAQVDYNRLAASVAAIMEAWRLDHPEETRSLAALARNGSFSALGLRPDLADRLEHLVREDARVADAADAFAAADLETIGRLAAASQDDATRLLRNQVPETLELVSMARALGAPASCGFGAGWGGSVWALVRTHDADVFLSQWLRDYRRRHGDRFPEGFVSPPADGVRASDPTSQTDR